MSSFELVLRFKHDWGNIIKSEYNEAAYYRDCEGFVYLRGMVTGGKASRTDPLFTLPKGYRPDHGNMLAAFGPTPIKGAKRGGGEGDSPYVTPRVDVTTDGDLLAEARGQWVSLDGSVFPDEITGKKFTTLKKGDLKSRFENHPGFSPAGYFLDERGFVHLRGVVRNKQEKNELDNKLIFTLPQTCRPSYEELHACMGNPRGKYKLACVNVRPSGEVRAVGDKGFLSLDGIVFATEKLAAEFKSAKLQYEWSPFEQGRNPPGHFKEKEEGFVYLRGVVKSAVLAPVIFTLPKESRPGGREVHLTLSDSKVCRVDVFPTGAVVVYKTGGTGSVSLDGIVFKAEQ